MHRKSSIIGGFILIAIGLFFLALQLFPGLSDFINIATHWPLIIIGIGGLFLLGAFLGTPPLAMPASIIAGTGTILYYQSLTGNWDTWAYVWTLFPGLAGIGIILMNVLSGTPRQGLRHGSRLLFASLILFLVFGAFLGGWVNAGAIWPLLLILLGVGLLVRNVLRR